MTCHTFSGGWKLQGAERGKKRSRSLPEIERGVDRATIWTHEILGMNRHLRDEGPRDLLLAAEAEVPSRTNQELVVYMPWFLWEAFSPQK